MSRRWPRAWRPAASAAAGWRCRASWAAIRKPWTRPASSRAAIESLAENYSDGVVAPVFWAALFGLPGLLAYKVINTADSMIGHKSRATCISAGRRRGWTICSTWSRRGCPECLVCAAAWILPGADPVGAWRAMWRDAKHHRSPNAGWPEAAFAGALGLAIAGPRVYHGELVDDHWMNEGGRPHAAAPDIRMALRLFVRACCAQAVLLMRAYLAVRLARSRILCVSRWRAR